MTGAPDYVAGDWIVCVRNGPNGRAAGIVKGSVWRALEVRPAKCFESMKDTWGVKINGPHCAPATHWDASDFRRLDGPPPIFAAMLTDTPVRAPEGVEA